METVEKPNLKASDKQSTRSSLNTDLGDCPKPHTKKPAILVSVNMELYRPTVVFKK